MSPGTTDVGGFSSEKNLLYSFSSRESMIKLLALQTDKQSHNSVRNGKPIIWDVI